MHLRYPAALALTLAFSAAVPAQAKHGPKPRSTPPPAVRAGELYSAKALRQARIILQLKLLELRSEHLERVRRAVERKIPIDELLKT